MAAMSKTAPQSPRALLPRWTTWAPAVGLVTLALTWSNKHLPVALSVVVAIILAASVLSAVEHAEVVAARVGEPFGSLILAVAVTVIEVGLIVMLMTSGSGEETQSLARDTVFSAVMITCNGILGLAILSGTGRRKGETGRINEEGSAAALATVVVLAALTLVVPRFTTSARGSFLTGPQLAFEAAASIVVYVTFVMTQSIQHRDFFLPLNRRGQVITASAHADPPPTKVALFSVGLLMCALVAVVGLAKVESPAIEAGVAAASLPQAFVGVVIALLVLAPETIAAYNAGRRGHLQVGINLAFGSAIASIGLTVPTLAALSPLLDVDLELGLGNLQIVLLMTTMAVGMLTVSGQRVTRLHGALHLVVLAAFLFMSIIP